MLYALSDNILDLKWGFLSVHMDQSELETLWKLKTQLLPLIISIQVPLIHTRCLFRLMQRTKLHLFKPRLNSSSVHIEKHSLVHQLEVGALLTFSIRVMHLSIVFNIFFYPSDRRPKVERGRQGWVWAFSEQTHLFQPAAVGTPGPCRMELELIGLVHPAYQAISPLIKRFWHRVHGKAKINGIMYARTVPAQASCIFIYVQWRANWKYLNDMQGPSDWLISNLKW